MLEDDHLSSNNQVPARPLHTTENDFLIFCDTFLHVQSMLQAVCGAPRMCATEYSTIRRDYIRLSDTVCLLSHGSSAVATMVPKTHSV